jgi:hypothetical protein
MEKQMKKALVTLAIGSKHLSNFKNFCYDSWNTYAQKHNLDLVVITNPLDVSPRAQSRSPAWQKSLILSQQEVREYTQVAWVDSDILINPQSPNIFDDVPIEMIGAVDMYAAPNSEDYRISLERLYEYWSKNGVKFINNISATDFHKNFGLEEEFQSVVQTGVLVLSPKHHRDLLEHVYNKYEDKGEGCWNFEMRPLSYEILKNKFVHWLNPKFNMSWVFIRQYFYPFLNKPDKPNSFLNKVLRKSGLTPKSSTLKTSLITKCATTAFLNNYFLHFAASANDMVYVDQKITSIFEI